MKSKRHSLLLAMATLMILTLSVDAAAQQGWGNQGVPRRSRSAPQESFDISGTYGHMWGGSVGTRWGTLRLGTAPSWSVAADIPVAPLTWVELSYLHQSGELNLDERFLSRDKLTDLSVNYWQIGGVRGLMPGSFMPFVVGSLGITYFSPAESTVMVDDLEARLGTATRFSFTLGLGFKKFFGQNERIGLRGSFKTMATLYDTSAGFWFGSGGGGVTFGGYAVWQFEVAGGLVVKLG